MPDAFSPDGQLALQRVRWLILLRWTAIGLVLLGVLVADVLFPGMLPTARLLAIVALLAAFTFAVMLVTRYRAEQPFGLQPVFPWLAALDRLSLDSLIKAQIVVDLLAYTLLLHWAGGAENPAASFYILQVIIAGVLLSGRWAFACAGASSLLYGLLMWLEYSGVLPHVHLGGLMDATLFRRPLALLALWSTLTSAFFVAAYIASSIVASLRRHERELYLANLASERRSEELAAANERLTQLENARATFLRNVTHELRAPLAAIQSYLRLLREGYIEQERIGEVATRAEKRTAELLALISDLLDLAQVERAELREGRETLRLEDTLREAADMLRPSAVEKRIEMQLDLDPDLPLVYANPRHLALLWTNLISNAIKYTPPGGKVTVRARCEGQAVLVDVSDTGIGIPPEDRDRVFTEFYRSEAARRFASQGTGIGLSIVQGVVRLYDGSIDFESAPGQGTTFHVRLPLTSLAASCPLPGARPRQPAGVAQTLV